VAERKARTRLLWNTVIDPPLHSPLHYRLECRFQTMEGATRLTYVFADVWAYVGPHRTSV
jgi:hypothetical protein